jgi:hypothetical protein
MLVFLFKYLTITFDGSFNEQIVSVEKERDTSLIHSCFRVESVINMLVITNQIYLQLLAI